jgi:carbon storage regulator
MLILSRKSGESIVIDGRIKVTIIRVEGEAIKVGIEAPAEVQVHRQEVYDEMQRNNQQAITRQKVPLPKFAAPITLAQKKSAAPAMFKSELRKP